VTWISFRSVAGCGERARHNHSVESTANSLIRSLTGRPLGPAPSAVLAGRARKRYAAFSCGQLCALAALAVWAAPLSAQKWQLQYFYDREKSSLAITDIAFASASRGVAVGVISNGKREQPTAVVTSDGGAHWQLVPLKETPVSLFLLNEDLGWIVTDSAIWRTSETGKSWVKVAKMKPGILRVYFANEKRGWAVGAMKTVLETNDGGAHWSPVAAAAVPNTKPQNTAYTWITFANPEAGLITGLSIPPEQLRRPPEWYDPERAARRQEAPHLSLSLDTRDGGKTWRYSSASLFGEMTRVRFQQLRIGLSLVEFSEAFAWPSEVYRLYPGRNEIESVYREKDRAISDIWLTSTGTAYLTGTEVIGRLRAAVPSKVKVLKSEDYSKWDEMEVDYRAVANRTIIAAADDHNLWLATDTGMILKLVE
jgi:hypothetical protein